jgi:acyl carrier protein
VDSISSAIRTFVQNNFLFGREPTFSDEDSFLEQGIIDSTGALELVTFLEDEYKISVADEELVPENLDSIANVVRFVASKDPSRNNLEN